MNKKVELLAPCGTYDSFLAAVNAGADAVYLAGQKFGARAYADNFSEEELIMVIRQSHLRNVRVYMTINTLIKEHEFGELYEYMLPYYRAGLDGVIIQDLGVFKLFREKFPKMELHVSTQMTVSSVYGARYMLNAGACRIVPARELTLQEIRVIKQQVPVEIEAFIHGAMCYCYSGQCLMSSIIGGRSGNRGRCAQPCRLPYKMNGKEQFYLSLKDMNTLENIAELIEAGIDSFKIEGRMKKPEYVAGVVSVYRKYIDAYYSGKSTKVSREDLEMISNLYIRSETGDGYYHTKHAKEMVTLDKPGYNGTDDRLLEKLHSRYVKELPPIEIKIQLKCVVGEKLQLSTVEEHSIKIYGPVIEKASNRAAVQGDLEKQLQKTGGTPFIIKIQQIELGSGCFVPVKWLNDLRRELFQKIYTLTGERN